MNFCTREMIVCGTLCISVVANMKITCGGGSSMNLEERVPRGGGEHVRFVDDEDAVAVARRLELRDVAQLADVVDAGVGRGVDLAHVHVDAFGDLAADRAGRCHGSVVGPLTQFSALARMRAAVVLPMPRTPEKR